MKIAFATTDGAKVDEHFGRAGMFSIHELTAKECRFLELRKFAEEGRDAAVEGTKGMGHVHDDRVEGKVERLSDCKVVYLTEIGGPSAARLVRRGIMPVKVKDGTLISDEVGRLFEAINRSPAPWLRKALGEGA